MAQCWLVKDDKSLAMQLEREIKKRSKKQKLAIIACPENLSANPQVQPFPPLLY